MICYKLTDKEMRTYGGFHWELGKWERARGVGGLCSDGMIHAYVHQLLAVLHDPIHADHLATEGARMFQCKTRGKVIRDGQVKLGAREMRLVKEVEMPAVTIIQYIRYSILCAAEVTPPEGNEDWWAWAVNWWVGLDRTPGASWARERAAQAAAVAWADASEGTPRPAAARGSAAMAAKRASDNEAFAEGELDLLSLTQIAVSDDPKWR